MSPIRRHKEMRVNATRIHPNIKLRIGVGFVQRFLDNMLIPLMAIHFARLYGPATTGLLIMVIAGTSIGCTFLGGHLADKYGRRPTLLTGELGACVAFAGIALVNSPLWSSGIATYGFYLLGTSMLSISRPANDSMIIDVSTTENRSRVYTIDYWSMNVAFVCGALVGGFLYAGYFRYLLLAAAALTFVVVAVTWFGISETIPKIATGSTGRQGGFRSILGGYVSVLRDRIFARLFLAALFGTGIEVQLSYYIGVRLSDEFAPQHLFGIGALQLSVDGVSMLGVIRAINTFLVVCLALLTARMFSRLSNKDRQSVGLALFTAGFMVLAVSNDPWLLITATVVFTVGELMDIPMRQTLLAEVVRPAARTRYMAVYYMHYRLALIMGSLCVTLGAVVAPLGMSLLYGAFGVAAILLCRSAFARQAEREDEIEVAPTQRQSVAEEAA